MKLVLCTPTDRRSAIGRVSSKLAAEWSATGHDVIIVSTDEELPQLVHGFGDRPVLRWDGDGVVDALLGADMAVHQIGNSFTFHAGSLEWLQRVRGVVVLHDFYLTDLFLGWCWHTSVDGADLIAHWYGPDAPAQMEAAQRSKWFLEQTADTMPMTEWLCAQALAVVTHSSWGLDRVLASTIGPVAVARMPYPIDLAPSDRPWPRGTTADPAEFNLLSFGMINSNRQVPTVIAAIARSDLLRERVTYHLLGPIRPREAFDYARQARTSGVRLQVHGVADNRTLVDAVHAADAIVALRRPCTEAASASVLEAMQAGRPVIVSNAGSSAELPDDVVVKIDDDRDVEGLSAAIRRLVEDVGLRARLGAAARDYVAAHHRMDEYAAQIVAVCDDALRIGMHVGALDEAVEQLAAWGLDDDRFDEFALAPIREFWIDNDGPRR